MVIKVKKILVLMFIFLMLVSLVRAEDIVSEIKEVVDPLENVEIPGPMGSLYGDEVFNLYIGNESVGHAVIEEKVFKSFSLGESGEPTMNIYADNEETVRGIINANNGLDKFNELKSEGKIRVEPIGFGKKIKWGFTSIATRIMGWFT